MLQLKCFETTSEGVDAFNKFVEKHPPRSTEKQSGIIFHEGRILVFFDNGKHNLEEQNQTLRYLCEQERMKKMHVDHDIKQAEAALVIERQRRDEQVPLGYTPDISDTQLRKLIKQQDYITDTTLKEMRAAFDIHFTRIQNLEDKLRIDTHESERLSYSIQGYENMLHNA